MASAIFAFIYQDLILNFTWALQPLKGGKESRQRWHLASIMDKTRHVQ